MPYVYVFFQVDLARNHWYDYIFPQIARPLLKARKNALKPLIDARPKIENRAAVKEVKLR